MLDNDLVDAHSEAILFDSNIERKAYFAFMVSLPSPDSQESSNSSLDSDDHRNSVPLILYRWIRLLLRPMGGLGRRVHRGQGRFSGYVRRLNDTWRVLRFTFLSGLLRLGRRLHSILYEDARLELPLQKVAVSTCLAHIW